MQERLSLVIFNSTLERLVNHCHEKHQNKKEMKKNGRKIKY